MVSNQEDRSISVKLFRGGAGRMPMRNPGSQWDRLFAWSDVDQYKANCFSLYFQTVRVFDNEAEV